jgi:hypothetical protein
MLKATLSHHFQDHCFDCFPLFRATKKNKVVEIRKIRYKKQDSLFQRARKEQENIKYEISFVCGVDPLVPHKSQCGFTDLPISTYYLNSRDVRQVLKMLDRL